MMLRAAASSRAEDEKLSHLELRAVGWGSRRAVKVRQKQLPLAYGRHARKAQVP